MHISYGQLREIKHSLPTGSVNEIAQRLEISEQTVRNYFGAHKYQDGDIVDSHTQPGPRGGIITLSDTRILDEAMHIIRERRTKA